MLFKITPLTIHSDERGRLTEIFKSPDDNFGFGQAYITTCSQGVIKAWHRHKKQVDRWFCVGGAAKLGLYDEENDIQQTVILSTLIPQLVTIPAGIWHGFTPVWGTPEAAILNIPSQIYNPESPDEQRVDPFYFNYDWSVKSK
jgi:dTDP-4-dehydrorhamnose 3,5-epimerase